MDGDNAVRGSRPGKPNTEPDSDLVSSRQGEGHQAWRLDRCGIAAVNRLGQVPAATPDANTAAVLPLDQLERDMEYPRKAWKLSPSLAPKEIELVKKEHWYGGTHYRLSTGGAISRRDVYDTKLEALEAARVKLAEAKEKIERLQASYEKKLATVEKAEAATS